MKKSILVLSLLLPAIANAKFYESILTKKHVSFAEINGDAPVAPAPVEESKTELTLKNVSSLELKDAKLSLDLTSEQIKISGVLPKECADRVSISDVQRFAASKSSEELKDVVLEKADHLKEYATTIQVQVSYASDPKNLTLCDCLENAKKESEKVDLSKDSRFARTVSLSPEMAIAGLVGESMNLKSPEYIKMEKQFSKLDCKDCNSDWSKISAHLKEARGFDSPLLASMMNKLFAEALSEMDKKIADANTLTALEKVRAQLLEMGEYASTDEQRTLAIVLFDKIAEKNNVLASSGHQTASMATKHADFARDTYSKMAKLPGVTEENRKELAAKADALAPGKEERLQYLSSIDGDHPEVRKYLRDSDQSQRNLQAKMQNVCSGRMNQYTFTQCGELQSQYHANQQRVGQLQSQFTLADNKNWNGIFAYWDKRNVAYDHNWRNTFINPAVTAPISSNSMPDMYDPRDPRYANFDASKLYQTNAVNSQFNPMFQQQPYSITPVR